ncbi:hypothetical protein [Rhizobium sp. Root1220]|uniref:hypothetical protein n=1 Tax=Rhizobium sp. Root1220 TaxID=1736432 RepID=UPI0007001FEB|nr:hypothetical protein [Rhizobium sp. Root1220]KQV83257.1 hypothetical protein ASC90_21940 [Rhizobium sp. Root1220]
MTEAEITEIFVRAAEVERKLPSTGKPAQLKAMNMGYVHTFAEMNHWQEEELHAANWAWLDPKNLRATTNDVGIWEAAMEMIKLIPDTKKRRALWAWATAEAGGQAFAKWCRTVEGVSRQLGDWRKDSAIKCILRAFDRKPLQHNENEAEGDFTNTPENSDKTSIIEVWRADDCFSFDTSLRDFSWADAQNERRRQREARRKQAA